MSEPSCAAAMAIEPWTDGRWLILADDLTGAADSAVALAGSGRSARVCLSMEQAVEDDATVWSVDLDTRAGTSVAAATRFGQAGALVAASGRHCFKKIDSTLRGHLAAELVALISSVESRSSRSGSPVRLCLIVPAHPELGRTLIDGLLQVDGVPVSIPGAAIGAGAACAPVSLAQFLSAEGLPAESLYLSRLHGMDGAALRQWLSDRVAAAQVAGASDVHCCAVIVCDAGSLSDLRRLVAAAEGFGHEVLWVGSGGLAQALGEASALGRPALGHSTSGRSASGAGEPTCAPRWSAARRGSRFMLVGSHSATARRQVQHLRDHAPIEVIDLEWGDVCGDDARRQRIDAAVGASRDVVLRMSPDLPVDPSRSSKVAAALARIAQPWLPRVAALVICGGDTARALLESIDARVLSVWPSAVTGVARATIDSIPGLPLMLKAGAFGDERTLLRLSDELLDEPRDERFNSIASPGILS